MNELLEARRFGGYTADEARQIGDCAIIAISRITGLSWDEVFVHAKDAFGQYGMNAGGIHQTMRALGWEMTSYFKMPWFKSPGLSVQAAEQWLQKNAPDVRLLCMIHAQRVPHVIAFADGEFHNVRNAWRAKLKLVDICHRM